MVSLVLQIHEDTGELLLWASVGTGARRTCSCEENVRLRSEYAGILLFTRSG